MTYTDGWLTTLTVAFVSYVLRDHAPAWMLVAGFFCGLLALLFACSAITEIVLVILRRWLKRAKE